MIKPQTLKGFRDFLPEQVIARHYVIDKIRSTFERFGYDPIETPALEYASVLLGKYGDEADKLIYLFEDRGGRRLGLRYDQTVPTARLIGQYPQLPLPFKRYQIQPVWRQEKPQKGRFREFLQCDADIFAKKITPLMDAEPIAIVYFALAALGFEKIMIKVNNRQTLFLLLQKAGIPKDKRMGVIISLDKIDKIGKDGVKRELSQKLGESFPINKILDLIVNVKTPDDLQEIINNARNLGVPDKIISFSPTLARGLEYYTGVIYEALITNYQVGSVVGGGRYDKLVGTFFGQDIPGSGFSFGFDRLIEAIEQFNLLPKKTTVTKVLVTVFSTEFLPASLELTAFLRNKGVTTELYLDPTTKLDKQLKYADKKGIPYAAIIGPEEVKNNTVTIKTLKTREQKRVGRDDLIKSLGGH